MDFNPNTDAAGDWTMHAPAVNTAAVATLAAPGAGKYNVVDDILFSYDAIPTNGSLTISGLDSANVVISIVDSGPGHLSFPRPLVGLVNTAVVVTLAAGGAACTGKVNVRWR